MKYTRLYADEQGKSHWEDLDVGLVATEYAPPAPPINVSSPVEARQLIFLSVPSGWMGDWHPSPARQFMLFTEGKLEVQTSDGDVRQFQAGDVVLGEDIRGKGHRSRVLGGGKLSAVVIQLPDETS